MDIRPIDAQMFINRASQISKSEDTMQRQEEQNLIFSEHFRKNVETENKKTMESNETEKENVNKDSNNKNYYSKQKKNKKECKKEEKANKEKTGFLDISI